MNTQETITKNSQSDKSDTVSNSNADQPKSEPSVSPVLSDDYMPIKEWGIKVKMRDASKVQYELKNMDSERMFRDAGPYKSYIIMTVKPEYLQDKNCDGASLGMYQLSSFKDGSGWQVNKIGDRYYIITGSPYLCDGGSDSSDNILNKRVLEDFTTANLSAL